MRIAADSGKVKRIRNDGRVLLAPATVRDKSPKVRPPRRGRAFWGPQELAEKAMERLGRRYRTTPIMNLLTHTHERAVLEITPDGEQG